MTDPERIHEVKSAAQARLLVLPGVHAVGVGPKLVGGKSTGELAIKVYLVRKKPHGELTADEVIPAEIDGVKTDVVQMDVPRLYVDAARDRPLLMGTYMRAKYAMEYGTLGFLATTSDGKLVAITCQHVVAPPMGDKDKASKLKAITPAGTPNPYQITFSGSNTPGSLILIKMADQQQRINVFVTTTAAETTLASVATKVVDAVNGLAGAGVTAAIGAQPEIVVITQNAGSGTVVGAGEVYDPVIPDPRAKLFATIAGNAITLSGTTDGEYAIYTSWDTNGNEPTHGGFTAVVPDSPLTDVAVSIAKTVNDLKIANITATPNGATVTIAGATRILCQIASDLRVGQPTDGFSSNCSLCCTDEIGRVVDAHTDLDVALVQLRRGLEYLNEVKGDDEIPKKPHTFIKGAHAVTDAEQQQQGGYPVNKRGATTGYTSGHVGHVDAVDASGYTTNAGENFAWTVFFRYYTGAMIVEGDAGVPFCTLGDSGSPVFNNQGQIVGMLFAGATRGVVTPIEQITNTQTGLGVTVVAAQALGVKHTVTDAEGALAMVRVDADELMTRRVLEAQGEIAATPAGRELAEVVRRHTEEVQTLVNTNRRVATVWRRYGGPQLVEAVFRYLQEPTRRPSDAASGPSLTERLSNLQRALVKYGSAALSADFERYGPQILALTDLSYAEMLNRLTREAL
jgi:hypothetical protein